VLAPLEPEDTRLVAPQHAEPVEVLHTREIIAQIHQLPTAQREVIAAVDVAGLAYTEAADVLQIPVGTVMSRLHRARHTLAGQLVELAEESGVGGRWSAERERAPARPAPGPHLRRAEPK
jgi:RNA polymerase sigma-70 factor (ECF subfamily)